MGRSNQITSTSSIDWKPKRIYFEEKIISQVDKYIVTDLISWDICRERDNPDKPSNQNLPKACLWQSIPNLSSLYKFDSWIYNFNPEIANVHKVFKEIAENIKSKIPWLDLKISISDRVPTIIHNDNPRLAQIITNLVWFMNFITKNDEILITVNKNSNKFNLAKNAFKDSATITIEAEANCPVADTLATVQEYWSRPFEEEINMTVKNANVKGFHLKTKYNEEVKNGLTISPIYNRDRNLKGYSEDFKSKWALNNSFIYISLKLKLIFIFSLRLRFSKP